MLARSKFFLQLVEKLEKLKLSLSKQHIKMLKTKSGTLKIKKICQNHQEIFGKFSVSRVVENLRKREILRQAVSWTFFSLR